MANNFERRAEKRRVLQSLTPETAQQLGYVRSDIDNDGLDLAAETGMSDPFDPVPVSQQMQLEESTARNMAALKSDPDGDGVDTATEVGLSDPFDSRDVDDDVFARLDAEQVQGMGLFAADLDGDGLDLSDEVGLTDPFSDATTARPRTDRRRRQVSRDLRDLRRR